MQKLLSIFIVLLAVIVLCALVGSLVATYVAIVDASPSQTLSEQFSLVPTAAVSAGVLVAILTFYRERRKHELERARQVSGILVERCRAGFDAVISLLADRNNNRLTWVRAARTLLRVLELKDRITSEEYKVVYQLEEERAKEELYNILSIKNEKTGARDPLPPQFFYGIKNWDAYGTLDAAAIEASSETVVSTVTIDRIPSQPYLRPLAPETVVAIFDFIEEPSGSEEPLDSVKYWNEDWSKSHGIDQGARRYVAHRKQRYAIAGKLHDKDK